MGPVIAVTDPADPRLADYQALTDVALRRVMEPAAGLFVAEGALVIERALRAGYRLRSVLLAERWLADLGPVLDGAPGDAPEGAPDGAGEAPVYVAAPSVLEQVTGFHVHRGALATFARRPLPPARALLADALRVVVCEDVNNPTNLGAIARSAAGLGMDALLLDERSCDPLYRRAIRVSMGEVLAFPHARLAPWPGALAEVRAAGFRILALTPDPEAAPIAAAAPAPGERVALLLGAEGAGLSAGALAEADGAVRIPMVAGVDSLNVAAAAAVACYVVGSR